MTGTSTNGSTRLQGGPAAPSGLRVEPPADARRQARVPWIVLGVLIVTGCALAAAVWSGRVAQRTPAVMLARAVERGQVLALEDLAQVDVAVDGQLSVIPVGEAERLIGRSAATGLPAGTLLSEQMVSDGPELAGADRVVGLALDPGEYPLSALQPGDEVMVVRVPPATAGVEEAAGAVVLASRARVYAVEPLDEISTAVLVSVLVDEATAVPVTAAAAQDRVRLVLAGAAP